MSDGNDKLYNFKSRSDDSAYVPSGESLTVQEDKEDADINNIVRRFGVTGEMPTNLRRPLLEDYDEVFDYQSAQNALIEARETFMSIPAEIRAKFDNDPQLFLQFCSDEKNLDEMRKMGLAVDKPVANPDNTPAPPTSGG